MTAKVIPFPGVKRDPKLTPPARIDAYRLARILTDVEELGHQTPGTAKLTASEYAAAARLDVPAACERCGAAVVAWAGEWWSASDGGLHANSCRLAAG